MGTYIYSVRVKPITVQLSPVAEKVYPLKYLTRAGWDSWEGLDQTCRLLTGRAEAVWLRHSASPKLVVLCEDVPQEFDPVYQWDGRAWDYDTPEFEGIEKRIGFLRRVAGCWHVSPKYFSAQVGNKDNRCFHVKGRCDFWTEGEAVSWIQEQSLGLGCQDSSLRFSSV
jgi:hypothetical protein